MDLDDDALDDEIKLIYEPDHHGFNKLIRYLKKEGEILHLEFLLECANKIVATQKTITPMETASLEILSKAVQSIKLQPTTKPRRGAMK